MKNLIERLSIKSGLTKLEVSALLFVLAAIVTGALIQIFRPDAKAEIPPAKEKSSAQLLKEETEKVVKEKGLKGSASGSKITETPKDSSININTATIDDFARIPGIGEEIAARIVAKRVEYNGFDSIPQLLKVKGIGKKTLDKIKRYLTL